MVRGQSSLVGCEIVRALRRCLVTAVEKDRSVVIDPILDGPRSCMVYLFEGFIWPVHFFL